MQKISPKQELTQMKKRISTNYYRYLQKFLFFCSFLLLFLFSLNVNAQILENDESKLFNPLTDDITKRLPPLRILIDSAIANSPYVRYEELKADYYYFEMLSQARYWTEHFSLNLDANFGRWTFNDRTELGTDGRFYFSESIRDNLAVGFYIRFPIASLIDRRNRINKQKKWIELSFTQREVNSRVVQREVIESYNLMVQWQNYIRIYNDSLVSTKKPYSFFENLDSKRF